MVARRVDAFPLPPLADIEAERAERSLRHFIRQAWHVVEPATPFVPGWHLDAIAEHLQAVSRGEIRNLLINVPPRHMKSLAVSVFWPVWEWTTHPERRWLYTAYALSLSVRDSLKCRRLIESPWYQARWGDRFQLTTDQNVKQRYDNDKSGYRIATSVGGAATGEGGDRIVVDDPHAAAEASSTTIREATLTWWDETMATRLNDPKTGTKVIVMQRLHEQDLAGHVLAQGGYEHLCLPAEYEPTDRVTGIGWRDPRTTEGELLWPARFGRAEIDALKATLGSQAAAAQLQQRPAPAEGAILKREWWQWYAPEALPLQFDWIVDSWDTAFKKGRANDYSVGLTMALAGNDIFLLDCWWEKATFPELKKAVPQRYLLHRPDEILVEDAASGQSLIQELNEPFDPMAGWATVAMLPIRAVTPDADKIARVHAVAPHLERHRIWLPAAQAKGWAGRLVEEAAAFPFGVHDDAVDAFTQGVRHLVAKAQTIRPIDPRVAAYFDEVSA